MRKPPGRRSRPAISRESYHGEMCALRLQEHALLNWLMRNRRRRLCAVPLPALCRAIGGLLQCPEEDSNLQGILLPPAPQAGASANFAIWAWGWIESASIALPRALSSRLEHASGATPVRHRRRRTTATKRQKTRRERRSFALQMRKASGRFTPIASTCRQISSGDAGRGRGRRPP